MIIGNYLAFYNLVVNDRVNEFNQLTICVQALDKICSCQKQRKSNKANDCNNAYINLVNTVIPNMVEYFKTKTNDSEIIFYHNSHHEIKRLKLR